MKVLKRWLPLVLLTTLILVWATSALAVERYQVIMYGDRDAYVLRLQKELYARGYLKEEPTGYFGDATFDALMRYQSRNDLEADGIAGIETQKKIYGKNYEAIPSSRDVYSGATNEKASDSFDSLRLESKGSDVKKVQIRLKELGYFKEDATSFFGEVTEKAVKAFQKNNGLSQDGVVGKKTFNLLFSTDAKKAASAATTTAITAKEQEEIEWDEAKWADADLGEPGGNAIIEEAISFAGQQIGKRYVSGGKGPNTFDCSGFTYYVLKHVGVSCSGSSKSQGNNDAWEKVDLNNLQRGDLLVFTNTSLKGIGHVGLYLGNGRFIHSSSGSAKGVTISTLTGSYHDRFLWGRRWAETAAPVQEPEDQAEAQAPVIPEEEQTPTEDVVLDVEDVAEGAEGTEQ